MLSPLAGLGQGRKAAGAPVPRLLLAAAVPGAPLTVPAVGGARNARGKGAVAGRWLSPGGGAAECFMGESTGQLAAGWKIPVEMLPGNSFAVKGFPSQRFHPERPACSRLLSAAWLAVPAPGPRLLPLGKPVTSLGEAAARSRHGVAAWRPRMPKSVGLHSEAYRAQDLVNRDLHDGGGGYTCKRFGSVRLSRLPCYFLERVLPQLPAGTAATARALNHPTASVPNKAKVSNATVTSLFGEPV